MPASYYDEHVDPVATWRSSKAREVVYMPAAVQCAIAGGPILDIGCGVGCFGIMLGEMGIASRGIDTSAFAVAIARCNGYDASVLHRKRLARYLHEAEYRTVVMLEALEHVYEDLSLLRLIPSGKRIVVSVPSSASVGHVRWFGSMAEAADRYRGLVHWQDGLTTEAKPGGNEWYIMRGVRR
jgi:SAM-dependent methyltransferase